MGTNNEIEVKKINGVFFAKHNATKLMVGDKNRDMAVFKLGQLVEKQMQLNFEQQGTFI